MLRAEPILALSERLRSRATRVRRPFAADLRLAAFYLKRLAALAIAEESAAERDLVRQRQMVVESIKLWQEGEAHV
jgi:hypothetical protein